MSSQRPRRPVGRAVAAVGLQTLGCAAILVLFPHGEPSGLVETVSGLPTVVLIPLAVPAIPATLLAFGVGAVLTAGGLSPASIPAVLLARGDVVVLASAAVVAAWGQLRLSRVR